MNRIIEVIEFGIPKSLIQRENADTSEIILTGTLIEELNKQLKLCHVSTRFYDAIAEINYNSHAEGCGLEDAGITDKYEAMEYGWNNAIEAAQEAIENVC